MNTLNCNKQNVKKKCYLSARSVIWLAANLIGRVAEIPGTFKICDVKIYSTT